MRRQKDEVKNVTMRYAQYKRNVTNIILYIYEINDRLRKEAIHL